MATVPSGGRGDASEAALVGQAVWVKHAEAEQEDLRFQVTVLAHQPTLTRTGDQVVARLEKVIISCRVSWRLVFSHGVSLLPT